VEEAERKIKIHQPALLLLDVCIGEEDGRIFCQKLKTSSEYNQLRVILMSGDDCEENRLSIADDFLSKPFDFNELLTKVNTAVSAQTV
jgi:DNA-binding response OmpR family regulator